MFPFFLVEIFRTAYKDFSEAFGQAFLFTTACWVILSRLLNYEKNEDQILSNDILKISQQL